MELRGGGLASKVAVLSCVGLCVVFFLVLSLTAGSYYGGSIACFEITSWRTESNAKVWRRPQQEEGQTSSAATAAWRRRRGLTGLGSHPPRCTSKCGGCTPCWPVHVPVPPRAPADAAEYYPEAWRCECGGRLYVP